LINCKIVVHIYPLDLFVTQKFMMIKTYATDKRNEIQKWIYYFFKMIMFNSNTLLHIAIFLQSSLGLVFVGLAILKRKMI